MAGHDLPPPVTVADTYLAAILAELQAIRNEVRTWPNPDAIDAMTAPNGESVEVDLKEPKAPKSAKAKK